MKNELLLAALIGAAGGLEQSVQAQCPTNQVRFYFPSDVRNGQTNFHYAAVNDRPIPETTGTNALQTLEAQPLFRWNYDFQPLPDPKLFIKQGVVENNPNLMVYRIEGHCPVCLPGQTIEGITLTYQPNLGTNAPKTDLFNFGTFSGPVQFEADVFIRRQPGLDKAFFGMKYDRR